MASLKFFRKVPASEVGPPQWGTGLHKEGDLWVPRAPTWHATGRPIEHPYKLTELKLSNVRDNDELVPRPEAVEITKSCINKPFPAEHPYASHIEKFSLFPKFDSPQDPKRGVSARQQRPISSEMPANPYQVTVIKKTKASPYREEIVTIPTEGRKEALYWPGENYFDQQSKIHGNKQQYYPIPPRQIAPNPQERPAELCISENTENVLKNIERNQWIPTQKLDYTGIGPANPMVLDNLDSKKATFVETGVWDDKLYSHVNNIFDPAHSLEGRFRKLFGPKSAQEIMLERQMLGQPDHNRKMTATEIEEHQLLNGREYVNLPETCNDPVKNMKCQEINYNTKPEPCTELQPGKRAEVNDNTTGQVGTDGKKKTGYMEEMRVKAYNDVQGMEARNRWQLLESSKPSHDIIQLREKYKILNRKEMPNTFYDHEGRYNEERAGLYKTSYDPQSLAYSMNARQLSGGVLFNTSMSHVDASLYPTIIWDENEAALKGSQTVVFKNSELSGDRPSASDVLLPYKEHVAIQRHMLQPTVETARPLVQEGKFILREDIYGDSYNTKMFLQENKLHRNIRLEPRDLMSHENQNLERARESSVPIEAPSKPGILKSVHFSDDVSIRNVHENLPVKIEESHIKKLSLAEKEELARAFGQNKESSLSYTETHPERPQSGIVVIGDKRYLAENLLKPPAVPTLVDRNKESLASPQFVSFTREPQLRSAPISETADKFSNLAVNFTPSGLKHESGQLPRIPAQHVGQDLGQKNDPRLRWEPGTGQLQPQSCLQDLQNSFVKSEVHKRFHKMFPETHPDTRSNFTAGKKHDFHNNHAEVIYS